MNKVIIISSLSRENDIKKVADYYKKLGYDVDYPIKQSDKEFSRIVEDYLYKISLADIVVAITKSDGTFGTGVTYELAFARYLNKRIVVITDLDGEWLNYEF